ncbi:RnfH family protein [Methylomonas sp. DH-1]|uniref:RnfH family protein n=1 Tax=Methylomonas sp. (strain DH-1) TaxID=1727196 RepID=UPI0007C8D7DA|nr:RnfH family protein [Methylomonas sp. DH-1]ANE55860.1 RnfH family protein [Methylomonas sp. DH-1]
MAVDRINVEVAYALPERQLLIPLALPLGSTADQAISASGIAGQLPDIDLTQQTIGIFGAVCTKDKVLADGDRVEIYRPLRKNPMEARRERVQK